MNQQRNSSRGLCYFLVFTGISCLLGTLMLTVAFRDTLKEKLQKPSLADDMSLAFEIDGIEQEIQIKDQEIKLVKLRLDAEQSLQEAREKLNELKGGKNTAISAASTSERTQAEKTKQLEQEKAQLLAKKEALVKSIEEKKTAERTWREWFDDYNIRLLLAGIVPLGLFGFFLMRLTFFGALPRKNPFSLTDFERRCVLFLPFAIVVSAFGFACFVWTLTIRA
jgi:hypothetical protein